jgi:hypothetical protein
VADHLIKEGVTARNAGLLTKASDLLEKINIVNPTKETNKLLETANYYGMWLNVKSLNEKQ